MRLNTSGRSATLTAAIALLLSVAAADLAFSQSSGGAGGTGAGGQSGATGSQGQGAGTPGGTGNPQAQSPANPAPAAPSATSPGTQSQTGTPSTTRPSAAGTPTTKSTATTASDMNAIPLTSTASDLKGKNVYDASGKKVGEVKDAVIESGQLKQVVIEYGGFLGIGEKAAAVPVEKLQMSGDRIVGSSLTRESLEAMPEFKK